MLAAENVYKAYQSRENYRDENGNGNWAEWAGKFPQLNEILTGAMMATKEEQDGGNG